MYPRLFSIFFLTLGALISIPLWANPTQKALMAFPDPPFVSWPEVKTVTNTQDGGRFSLALGPMKNRNGRWSSETLQTLQGKRWRRVFELPRDRDQQEALDTLTRYMSQFQRVDKMFACRGHTCGSSNAWANQHFNIRQLYGLEQAQWYRADQMVWRGRQWIQAIYGVTRGNRRTYVLIDRFELSNEKTSPSLSSKSEQDWATTLNHQGAIVVSDAKGEVLTSYRERLIQLLQAQPDLSLMIVASTSSSHAVDVGSKAALTASEAVADKLKQQLVAEGAPDNRILPVGVGDRLLEPQRTPMIWVKKWKQPSSAADR